MALEPSAPLFVETGHLSGERGRFADNITHFARALRKAGLPVGPSRVVDAIRAVEVAGIESRDDFYWTLHAVFVSKREHHAVYDAAFALFWRSRNLLEKMLEVLSPSVKAPQEQEKPKAAAARVADAMMAQKLERQEEMAPDIEVDAEFTVSGKEVLQDKDFAQMSAAEIAAAKASLSKLVLPVSPIRTRRFAPALYGERLDLRRTIRKGLASGGEMLVPIMRKRREVTPPIVALCDISGSMSQYSRLFLHFLHALAESRAKDRGRVHSFVFGTRLTNVTRSLARKDPDEALEDCGALVQDWSGGTRIATALHDFNRQWSRRVLGQNAIVLLITDGLERDTDEDLSFEMERLHKSCRELIWLNPLLRFDRFEARASGVRAMLPHVDQFRTIHSLDAIADLCVALGGGRGQSTDPRIWLQAA